MTGRGSIGKLDVMGNELNVFIFSIKFFKSNLDVLSAHRLGFGIEKGPARDFVRREAGKNIIKITSTLATIMFVAKQLGMDVELDPRSTKFGQICEPEGVCYNISGGMRTIVTLAARMVPTKNGDKGGLFGGGWSF